MAFLNCQGVRHATALDTPYVASVTLLFFSFLSCFNLNIDAMMMMVMPVVWYDDDNDYYDDDDDDAIGLGGDDDGDDADDVVDDDENNDNLKSANNMYPCCDSITTALTWGEWENAV